MSELELYLDSADLDDMEELVRTGVFTGITTNPTILAKAGRTDAALPEIHRWAVDHGLSRVFFQTLGLTSEEVLASGRRLWAIGPEVVVKVPSTSAGLIASGTLVSEGIPVLLTAVHHSSQALLARALKVRYIAPYVGRMTDAGRDGIGRTIEMHKIVDGNEPRVLAASLRSVEDVTTLAAAGLHVFTVGTTLAREMLSDPLVTAAAEAFEAVASDW